MVGNFIISITVAGLLCGLAVFLMAVLYYSAVVSVGIIYLLSGRRKRILTRRQRFIRGCRLFMERYPF